MRAVLIQSHGELNRLELMSDLPARTPGVDEIAFSGTEEKYTGPLALGCDGVINYREVDFVKVIWEADGKPSCLRFNGGVNVVVNFTGGASWVPSLKTLCHGGAYSPGYRR